MADAAEHDVRRRDGERGWSDGEGRQGEAGRRGGKREQLRAPDERGEQAHPGGRRERADTALERGRHGGVGRGQRHDVRPGEGTVFEKSRTTINIPASGWAANAQGWQEKTVDCAGTVVSSAVQRVDVAVQGAQIGRVLLAGARVDANDKLTLVCLAAPPAFDLMVILSEVRT